MALLKRIWLFITSLFKRKPKQTRTKITRDEILAYANATPHIKNSVKKTKKRHEEKLRHESNSNKKKISKKKAQKQARKKNR